MARALMAALDHAGHAVSLASDLRLYDGEGDADRQTALAQAADQEVRRLSNSPDAAAWTHWLTYHNYYKAPDLIGPRVSAALGIPYLQIESTRAKKRLSGPWGPFAAAAEAASDAAHTILYFTRHDAETLRRDRVGGQHLVHLPPFLARAALPPASDHSGPMLTVAMMRPGDKMASYALVADTLEALPTFLDWRLDIVGDGAARADVDARMARFGTRVRMLGAIDPEALASHYATARALFWPGVNEAFGMVYLEAQAAGIPVIAQDRPGVRDVVATTLAPPTDGPRALAQAIEALYAEPSRAATAGTVARQRIADQHLLPHAAQILRTTLEAAT